VPASISLPFDGDVSFATLRRRFPAVVGRWTDPASPRPAIRAAVGSNPGWTQIRRRSDATRSSAVYRARVRVRSLLGRHGVDAVIVLFAAAAQAEVWFSASQRPRAVTAPLALFWTLALLLRKRFPLGAPVGVFVVLAAEAVAVGDVVTDAYMTGFTILAAFAAVGAHPDLRSALIGGIVGYGSVAVILVDDRTHLSSVLSVIGASAVSWAIARAFVDRGRRAEHLAERADRLERSHAEAVAGERATIARELHDVIAHSVSVMTVQAGAARVLLDEDPTRARESLVAVEETGRQALGEMRRLLGILRGHEYDTRLAPQPGIADIDALVEQVRAAGLPVDVRVDGEPRPLPPGVDLAAYRVVQEALTNALKHAGAARAEVSIRYGPAALELAVTNDGRVRRNGRVGHGLVGMRERVALYGGDFEAGPRREGGYAVRASLPMDAPAP
jgi:signal transduction histidine kinase